MKKIQKPGMVARRVRVTTQMTIVMLFFVLSVLATSIIEVLVNVATTGDITAMLFALYLIVIFSGIGVCTMILDRDILALEKSA